MRFADHLEGLDRAVFTQLGGAVQYVPRVGAGDLTPIQVTGVFDLESQDPRGDPQVAAVGPILFVAASDLVTAAGETFEASVGDEVIAGSTTYRVREPRPDGLGGVLLHLQAV